MARGPFGFPPPNSPAFRRRLILAEALGPPRARAPHPFFRPQHGTQTPSQPTDSADPHAGPNDPAGTKP